MYVSNYGTLFSADVFFTCIGLIYKALLISDDEHNVLVYSDILCYALNLLLPDR